MEGYVNGTLWTTGRVPMNSLCERGNLKSKIYCNGRVDGRKLHSHCNMGNAQLL